MSNTPDPDDKASFSQAESSEEELDHRVSVENCQVCWELQLPVPENVETTYADLQRRAADGCELCELLRRMSEAACSDASTGTVIQSTDAVFVNKRSWEVGECVAHLEVRRWAGVGCTSQSSLYFRLIHYKSCTDDVAGSYRYMVSFYAATGRAYIAYEYI